MISRIEMAIVVCMLVGCGSATPAPTDGGVPDAGTFDAGEPDAGRVYCSLDSDCEDGEQCVASGCKGPGWCVPITACGHPGEKCYPGSLCGIGSECANEFCLQCGTPPDMATVDAFICSDAGLAQDTIFYSGMDCTGERYHQSPDGSTTVTKSIFRECQCANFVATIMALPIGD